MSLRSQASTCIVKAEKFTCLAKRVKHHQPVHFQPCLTPRGPGRGRAFSSTRWNAKSQTLDNLPPRRFSRLKDTPAHELLCLEWSQPPRNILLIKKDLSEKTTEALKEFSKHVRSTYSEINIIVEPNVSSEIGDELPGDHFTCSNSAD